MALSVAKRSVVVEEAEIWGRGGRYDKDVGTRHQAEPFCHFDLLITCIDSVPSFPQGAFIFLVLKLSKGGGGFPFYFKRGEGIISGFGSSNPQVIYREITT